MLDKKYKKLGGKIVIDTLRIDQKHYIKALEKKTLSLIPKEFPKEIFSLIAEMFWKFT